MAAPAMLAGFWNLQDRADELVTTIGTGIIDTAVRLTVDEFNKQQNALGALFASPTVNHTERYKGLAAGMAQKTTAEAKPDPVKFKGFYDVAFPIEYFKRSMASGFVAKQKMTVADMNRQLGGVLVSFAKRRKREILARLFTNTPIDFPDTDFGTLSIKGLANSGGTPADTDVFQIINGADAMATDDHYRAQAGAIADGASTNPYPIIRDELDEHPENGGETVVLVPTNQKADTENLTDFTKIEDKEVRAATNREVLIGTYSGPLPGSAKIFGRVNECWVAHWADLPANYMIGVKTLGDRALGERQHPEAGLRGLVKDPVLSTAAEDVWMYSYGFGGRNKVNAVVYRVGNASYAIPSGYTCPLI